MKKKRNVTAGNEVYMIEVEDWEMSYSFGVQSDSMKVLSRGDYDETPTITLFGKITWPTVKEVERAAINMTGSQKLDGPLSHENEENPPQYVGHLWTDKPRKTLRIDCSVPSRSVAYVAAVATAGRIKHVSVNGTKLKYAKGFIGSIFLGTKPEE